MYRISVYDEYGTSIAKKMFLGIGEVLTYIEAMTDAMLAWKDAYIPYNENAIENALESEQMVSLGEQGKDLKSGCRIYCYNANDYYQDPEGYE